MRTIVASEFFSLLDLRDVKRVCAVQAGAPDGELIVLWPPLKDSAWEEVSGGIGETRGGEVHGLPEGDEVLVELRNLRDPAAVLRVEILARSSLGRRPLSAGINKGSSENRPAAP